MAVILKKASKFGMYDINFYDDRIRTVVTSCAAAVDIWIESRMHDLRGAKQRTNNMSPFIVGLDIEWYHVDDNVATLQLCIGKNCLVYQILRSDGIPFSLAYFLGNPCFLFVGVGVMDDADKLYANFRLRVASIMDLRALAALRFDDPTLARLGLKAMCRKVLNLEMAKPLHVTLSRWDDDVLDYAQIEYACIDAYVSSQLGVQLFY